MKNWKLPTLFKTPLGVVIALGLLIMVIDFLIMAVIKEPFIYMNVPDTYGDLIEVILLTLVIIPLLYSLVFKKLKSEALLQQINATVQEAIVIVNEHGRITEWNPAAQRKFQYSQAEAIGQPLHQLLAPSHYHADAARGFAEFQKTGKGLLIGRINEVTAIRKDGSEFPLELSVTAFKVKGSWQAVGVMRDISERKRAKDTLRASEEKFSTIFESNPAMIAIGTAEGTIVDVNQSYADFLGYTRQEMTGKSLADLGVIGEDELQSLLVPGRHAGDSLRNVEVTMRTRDGNPVNVLLSAEFISLNGMPYRLATLQDITASKQAEEALRASEAEFHTLAEAMPQIVWITRPDGWNIYFNRQWMEYTGLTLEESLGHGWNKPFHPDDQQRAWDAWQLAVAGRGIYSIESRLRRADGVYRWWLVRGVPVKDPNGDILKWFGTCTDIHDLKMAELAISNTNAELRESERRFSDMLGNIELISMMLDREARITYCNEYLLRLTGWKREEIIGGNWFDIFVPPELSLKDSFFEMLLADLSEAHHHENEILTRSGERLLVHWNNSVLRSVDGDVIGTASIGEDITSHRQAMAEIEFTNTILQTQQEASPDAILVVDENALITSLNQQFIDMWRLTPQMVSARLDAPVLKAVAEQIEDAETFVARIQYLYEHRDEKGSDEIKLKDGRVIDRYSAPVIGANGKYYGRIWYFRDITVRKKLELDREQYLKFFVLSINPMCIADPYGCFTQVNPAFVKLTGYSESELIAKPFLDFVLPEDRKKTEDEMKLQVEKRPTLYFDNRYLCKDGSVIDLSWTAYYDKQDGITYATANDITQFKQAQQALQASRENLHRLLNSIAEGAYGLDTHGNCTFVNRSFLRMMGYQVEAEVLGKNVHELIHYSRADGSPYPEIECKAYRAYRVNQSINVSDEVFWRKDGVAVPVEYWSHPIVSDGVTIGAIVTFIDITERKQAEAEIAEQLAELRRWHEVTSGREARILELKHEVNELLGQAGQPMRYPSAALQDQLKE